MPPLPGLGGSSILGTERLSLYCLASPNRHGEHLLGGSDYAVQAGPTVVGVRWNSIRDGVLMSSHMAKMSYNHATETIIVQLGVHRGDGMTAVDHYGVSVTGGRARDYGYFRADVHSGYFQPRLDRFNTQRLVCVRTVAMMMLDKRKRVRGRARQAPQRRSTTMRLRSGTVQFTDPGDEQIVNLGLGTQIVQIRSWDIRN
ncbi:hypothetical protein C8R44DRAFT_731519 [Mycena epipterygia]|nr:hypothetical protein C8R44DRAFT_731519 [Mycena epipterygia]